MCSTITTQHTIHRTATHSAIMHSTTTHSTTMHSSEMGFGLQCRWSGGAAMDKGRNATMAVAEGGAEGARVDARGELLYIQLLTRESYHLKL